MTLEGMVDEMRKKGKMYKIRKREGELIYDVRRKDGKKEGKKEITYRYVGNFFSLICKLLNNCRETYRPPDHGKIPGIHRRNKALCACLRVDCQPQVPTYLKPSWT